MIKILTRISVYRLLHDVRIPISIFLAEHYVHRHLVDIWVRTTLKRTRNRWLENRGHGYVKPHL